MQRRRGGPGLLCITRGLIRCEVLLRLLKIDRRGSILVEVVIVSSSVMVGSDS
jgi:hypothetical protein